ncbi:hypothetical protein BSKO_09544 [Bryopsis sp. KO-2023]|nr:hypothetical protein BSKO_09544 [Bryopsis sp. KO-2023]
MRSASTGSLLFWTSWIRASQRQEFANHICTPFFLWPLSFHSDFHTWATLPHHPIAPTRPKNNPSKFHAPDNTGGGFFSHACRRGLETEVNEKENAPEPSKLFTSLESTFGELKWTHHDGDFDERLKQEPLKPAEKEEREAPPRTEWALFIEAFNISDFTDVDAIRAIGVEVPPAKHLVDATCEKVEFLRSLGIGSYFDLDRILRKLNEDDQVVHGNIAHMKENLEWMKYDADFTDEQLRSYLVKNPKALTLDLEREGMPLVTLLRDRLLLKDPEINEMLLHEPILLTKGVAKRLYLMWEWLQAVAGIRTKSDLRSVLIRYPRLYSTDRFFESGVMGLNYEFLVWASLGRTIIVSGIKCNPPINPFEKKRVARAVVKAPRVLVHDLDRLKEAQQLIFRETKCKIGEVRWLIRNRPRILILDAPKVVVPRIRLVRDILQRDMREHLMSIYRLTFVPIGKILQRLAFIKKVGRKSNKWKIEVMFGKSDSRFCKEIVKRSEEQYAAFQKDFAPTEELTKGLFPEGYDYIDDAYRDLNIDGDITEEEEENEFDTDDVDDMDGLVIPEEERDY